MLRPSRRELSGLLFLLVMKTSRKHHNVVFTPPHLKFRVLFRRRRSTQQEVTHTQHLEAAQALHQAMVLSYQLPTQCLGHQIFHHNLPIRCPQCQATTRRRRIGRAKAHTRRPFAERWNTSFTGRMNIMVLTVRHLMMTPSDPIPPKDNIRGRCHLRDLPVHTWSTTNINPRTTRLT
jgi:hypothetical protein